MTDLPIYARLELLGPRVLVRPLTELDTTKGGLVIPDNARLQQNRAIVEKVGPGRELETGAIQPLVFAVGDVVFYQKFAGAWVTLAQVDRLMLMDEEIQARIPADQVTLVHHDGDDTQDHLEGEPCLICLRTTDLVAKASLAQMREELLKDGIPASSRSGS